MISPVIRKELCHGRGESSCPGSDAPVGQVGTGQPADAGQHPAARLGRLLKQAGQPVELAEVLRCWREEESLRILAKIASDGKARDDRIDEFGKPCRLIPALDGEDGFEVRPSSIHGHGTFCLRPFAEGATLGHAATVRTEAENRNHPKPLCVDRTVLGRYVNHAQEPNTHLVEQQDGQLHLVARKQLHAGDEMTCHYGDAIRAQVESYRKKNKGAGK